MKIHDQEGRLRPVYKLTQIQKHVCETSLQVTLTIPVPVSTARNLGLLESVYLTEPFFKQFDDWKLLYYGVLRF